MNSTPDDGAIAAQLLDEHKRSIRFSPVRPGGELLSLDRAYAVQRHYAALRSREWNSDVAGYKIGLTSAAMQQMCGIAHPVYGSILRSAVFAGPAQFSLAGSGRLGVEFEIAVRMGRDFGDAGPDCSVERAAQAVDAVAVALELVDDRDADYAQLDAASLVADNAWNAGVVLGGWMPMPVELGGRHGISRLGGQAQDEGDIGRGSDHPMASLAWLASELSRRKMALRKGDIVMTGSIVRTRFPAAGQEWSFSVEGLGAVSVAIRE